MIVPPVEKLFEGVTAGDRVMLARGITLVESTHADHWELAKDLLDACLPLSGKASRIGITGAPGVGKSTFIEAFASRLISSENRRVAVLAYDPASERTGGSILGDKTRMARLANHPKAFVRPAPGKRQAGGIGGGHARASYCARRPGTTRFLWKRWAPARRKPGFPTWWTF